MDLREGLLQSLVILKKGVGNIDDNASQLIRSAARSKYIDYRLKFHLANFIPELAQTNLFAQEDLQRFIDTINMKVASRKKDEELAGLSGYSIVDFSWMENQDIRMINSIKINKKGGVNDRVIIHEAIHAITQNYSMKYNKGFFECVVGFRKEFYDNDLKAVRALGDALNEGFTEIVTSKVLDLIKAGMGKAKIAGVKRNKPGTKYRIKERVFGKHSVRFKKGEPFNPYGFEYDEFDNKYGGQNYTVYKKIAELLDYASGGSAVKYFAKGDLEGFTKKFDKVSGRREFKRLLLKLDGFENRYQLLLGEYFEYEIDNYRDIYKDKKLIKSVKSCTDSVIEYFSKSVSMEMCKDTVTSEFIKKLTEFEKLLPKNIDKSLWNENKNRLLHDFAKQKLGLTTIKDEKECRTKFDVLSAYYYECLKDKNKLNEDFTFQPIPKTQSLKIRINEQRKLECLKNTQSVHQIIEERFERSKDR